MTITIDHLNKNRNEDPAYWYLWASDFKNSFMFMYSHQIHLLDSEINIDLLPPEPGAVTMRTTYFCALELYMKAYLLSNDDKVKSSEDKPSYLKDTFGHNLDKLRKRCAELDKEFDMPELIWIIEDLKILFKSDWSFLKYPPYRKALKSKTNQINKDKKLDQDVVMPGLSGEEQMFLPLNFLDNKVKAQNYIED